MIIRFCRVPLNLSVPKQNRFLCLVESCSSWLVQSTLSGRADICSCSTCHVRWQTISQKLFSCLSFRTKTLTRWNIFTSTTNITLYLKQVKIKNLKCIFSYFFNDKWLLKAPKHLHILRPSLPGSDWHTLHAKICVKGNPHPMHLNGVLEKKKKNMPQK